MNTERITKVCSSPSCLRARWGTGAPLFLSLIHICSSIRMSGKQANELFKREYGCTVAQFINRFRLFRAKELLCYTNSSITEIATMTGFKTVHYFSRYFKEKENLSPIEYKRTVTETISLHTLCLLYTSQINAQF